MGIIFRNGIPFGAAEDDVTTVYAYEDLFDLTDKKENHLYIVEESNKSYRYDAETENFYPLGADIPPITSERDEIIVGNGSNWAKGNGHKYYVVYSNGNQENIIGSLLDMPVAFGSLAAPAGQTNPTLKNGYKAQDNAIADISGNARLYMGETSRLAIHDDAWLDVTGQGTEVKFNSGSKFFVDSLIGPNRLYMHGAWVALNDAKNPDYDYKTDFTWSYFLSVEDYPTKPTDINVYIENGSIIKGEISDDGPPIDAKVHSTEINSYSSHQEVLDNGYVVYTTWIRNYSIGGKWEAQITYRKTYRSSNPLIHGTKPYLYGYGNWPRESQDVPIVNITGAPHINIGDYSDIIIVEGAHVEFSQAAAFRMRTSASVNIDDGWIVLQGRAGSSHPFLEIDDADKKHIMMGFSVNDITYQSGTNSPIMSEMMAHRGGDKDTCPTAFSSDDVGPYNNFPVTSIIFPATYYTPFKADWFKEKINGTAREDLLPFLNISGKTYIHMDTQSGEIIVEPLVEGKFHYLPVIGGSSTFVYSPVLGGNSTFITKFGGSGSTKTKIQWMLQTGAEMDILGDPAESSKTFFHYNIAPATLFGLHIGSIDSSNLLFKIFGGMGEGGYINGVRIGSAGRPGTIYKNIEGVDTFEMENGFIHKEILDYSRFIMRGLNWSGYNNPSTSYQNDISQFDRDGRISIDKIHLHKYWDRPINNEGFDKSPTFQMYECSNLILRGWWNYPTFTNIKISSTAYSYLQNTQVISLEEFKSHTTEWEEFLNYFSDRDAEFIGLVPESEIIASSTDITIKQARVQYIGDTSYVKKYHPNAGLDTFGKRSSLLEITDNSELRLWDGICIYARYNPETNEPGVEIVNRYNKNGTDGSGAAGEIDRVEFTFEELKYLKRFIGTLPSRIANNDSEATEPNTLYFIPGE